MTSANLRGKDFITLLDFDREDIDTILDVAHNLKQKYNKTSLNL
jgi:ornithine carbamoyltransferase